MSLRSFLQACDNFAQHLMTHHTIEERHVFPILAKRMPAFRKELELLTQHKEIHNGLEKFKAYIAECWAGERELRFAEMREKMDTFKNVLWENLDEEVQELRAENMRKCWTLDEMRGMPM
jgi:hemerythrin-like domain-containing protein